MADQDGRINAFQAVGFHDGRHFDFVSGGNFGERFARLHHMLPPGRGAGGATFAAGGLRGFDEAGDFFGDVVVDVFFILSAGGIQRANLALQVFQLRLQRLYLRRRGIRGLIGLTGAHVALQLAELIFRRIEAIVHAS